MNDLLNPDVDYGVCAGCDADVVPESTYCPPCARLFAQLPQDELEVAL